MGLIRDEPAEVPAGEPFSLVVTPLPDGRQASEWAAFTATIREDPKFPREGAELGENLDPVGDGWTVIATASGTGSGTQVTFPFPAGVPHPGKNRYAVDAKGTGGTAGEAAILDTTWLTGLPRVTA